MKITAQPLKYILVATATALLTLSMTVFAAPPTSPFTSGETLDPGCAPSDANCYVGASIDNFATADLTLTGDRTHDMDGNTLLLRGGNLGQSTPDGFIMFNVGINTTIAGLQDNTFIIANEDISSGGSPLPALIMTKGDSISLFYEEETGISMSPNTTAVRAHSGANGSAGGILLSDSDASYGVDLTSNTGISLNVSSSYSAIKIGGGVTAIRPVAPNPGDMRYNETDNMMEYYNGTTWIQF